MRRVFADQDAPGQRQSGSPRLGLLPIGNGRPRSLHVPSSPYSRKSNGSRRSTDDASLVASNPRSSGTSSPDILDFMFIPSASSLPPRPDPIKFVRESLGSFEGNSDKLPTLEALRQTFPETPQAGSPLFFATIGTPGVLPLPPSTMGTPGTSFSVAQMRRKLRRGIPNLAIARTTSLYTRKTPSSSDRTRMTPIPSVPGTSQSTEVLKVNDARTGSRFEVQQSQAAANSLTPLSSTTGEVSSPPPPSPRRNSDPTGRVSRDLETFASRAELPEEVFPSTLEVKELDPPPSESAPSQQFNLTPLEKSPSPSVYSLSVAEDEISLSASDPQEKDGDHLNAGPRSRASIPRFTQPDKQVHRPALKQRPRPLDLPAVNPEGEPTMIGGSVTKQIDESPGSHQGQGSARPPAQMNAILNNCASSFVSTDLTTLAQASSTTSIRSSGTTEQSPPPVKLLASPDISSHPSPNPSLQSSTNVATTSSFSQRSPAQLPSNPDPTPTPSTSQIQNTSPALPSSTLASPVQHDRSNSLDVPPLASVVCHSYADLAAIHPPPPYQTAILSQVASMDGENEPHVGPSSLLHSYIHTPPNGQRSGPQPAQFTRLPQAQWCLTNSTLASKGPVRERAESVPDIRIRPLGPRKPSGTQGHNKFSSLESYRLRAGSVSSVHPNLLRSGVGLGTPPTSSNHSAASIRVRSAPRFPTVPVKWRGYTLDVARWTFTSQQLQEISSRAIKASAESYYVRLLRLETLDTELPEELHRLDLLTTDLKTRVRATVAARRELLDALTIHASGARALDHHDLEGIVEELGAITQLADELNDELYTVSDQIAQLKRLRDVHSSGALAMSLRKLNTSFLRQSTENQLLRERVAALEAERDIAWTQAEHVAQEFDDLSAKLDQGAASASSSGNNSRRASRVSAVRKSNIRLSQSGLRHSFVGKGNSRASNCSSSISSFIQPSEVVPPVPPIPDIQDSESGVGQQPRHRPPLIQTVNLPGQFTPGVFVPF